METQDNYVITYNAALDAAIAACLGERDDDDAKDSSIWNGAIRTCVAKIGEEKVIGTFSSIPELFKALNSRSTGSVVEDKTSGICSEGVGSNPTAAHHAGESSTLDMTTPRDQLRWALSGLEMVANGLRNRRNLGPDDVEMINLASAKGCVEEALRLIRLSESPR